MSDDGARNRISNEVDETFFVEAGAGAGKTSKLVDRIVGLVVRGVELPRIAAITFTEAAAGELRDRIRADLASAHAKAVDPIERARFAEALDVLDEAPIQTLHAFAARILTAYAVDAGLPPVFDIRDGVASSIQFDRDWTRFVDRLLSSGDRLRTVGVALALDLKPDALRKVAEAFGDRWDQLRDVRFRVARIQDCDPKPLLAALDAAIACAPDCTDPTDNLAVHLSERLVRFRDDVVAAARSADPLDLFDVLTSAPKLDCGRGGQDAWGSKRRKEEVQQLTKAVAAAHVRLLADQRSELLLELLEEIRVWVVGSAHDRCRDGTLEFHDLLVLARDVLVENPHVLNAVRAALGHVHIDEFQDTDPLQADIALLLGSSAPVDERTMPDGVEIERGRLFFVGDPKQSIFRFRRADIDLYARMRERFAADLLELRRNHRSVAGLLEWVNAVFSRVLSDEAGQAPWMPLGRHRPMPSGDAPAVFLLGGPSDEPVGAVREREAEEVAATIVRAVAGRPPWRVEDEHTREWRDARLDDVAVLIPSRTALPTLERALTRARIPYRVEARSLIWATQEARDLLAILRAIADPSDQVAVVAALRSPALTCSDRDLLDFRAAGGSWTLTAPLPTSLPADQPVVAAMSWLATMHARRHWEAPSALADAVVRERRMLELAFALPRQRESWSRLRFVVDQARAFADRGGRTLREFVDWADRQADDNATALESVVPERDDRAVRITTIHAAKGREFPIVVATGLNVDGRPNRTAKVVWTGAGTPEVEVGDQKLGWRTPGFTTAKPLDEERQNQEELRLLYVACTRARDHLVVSLHHKVGRNLSLAARLTPALDDAEARGLHVWLSADELPTGVTIAAPADDHRAEGVEAPPAGDGERIAEVLARAATVRGAYAATAVANLATVEDDDRVDDVDRVWRRGRAGSSFGRAVHGVLQVVDLAGGVDDVTLASLANDAAAAEGVADRSRDVMRAVRSALSSDAVRAAVAGGRLWREVYVAGVVGDRSIVVDGYIDLLYESADDGGGLVVVDYKTDSVDSEADVDAKLAHYRLQLATYALALTRTLGRPVAGARLVFARPSERAIERTIDDLTGAMAEVERLVGGAE